MLPILWQKIDINGVPIRNLSNHWPSKFDEFLKASGAKNYSYHILGDKTRGIFPVEISLSGHQHFTAMIESIESISLLLKETRSPVMMWAPEELDEWMFRSPTLIDIMKRFKSNGVRVFSVCSDLTRKNNLEFDEIASPRFSINIFEQAARLCLSKEEFVGNEAKKDPTRHYICLNNMIRPSKIYVLSRLAKKDLITKGHVSALNSKKSNRHDAIFEDIKRSYLSSNEQRERVLDINRFVEKHLSYDDNPPVLPLELDTPGSQFDPWGFYYDYNKKPFGRLLPYHNDACISIVNETESTWIKNHQFSEKIYLPIAFKTPFLVVGNQGYLTHLRSQGYQTFPELFDESYDDIDDPIRRADMVVEQIEKYCSMPVDLVKRKLEIVEEKLNYNQSLFLSCKDFSIAIDDLFNKIKCILKVLDGGN